MNIEAVESIPKRKEQSPRASLSGDAIRKFMAAGAKRARLTGFEKDAKNMAVVLYQYAYRHKIPIRVYRRGEEIYLEREDI